MPLNNRVIIASAGSGKTTTIVDDACGDDTRRAAIITYTNNGREEITAKAYQRFGCVPPQVHISTWYAFLLRHFVRPYQNCLHDPRVAGIQFVNGRSAPYVREDIIGRHYFSGPDRIYVDKVSKFACKVIEKTDGLPLQRFEQIFDRLFIDESQDLAGYDLELVEMLLKSNIEIMLVGDHRQATYSTNSAAKNKKYGGPNIVLKFEEWEKAGFCGIDYHNYSHRCIQAICDLADQFHPKAPDTESRNTVVTGHDGVFAVRKSHVSTYMDTYNPKPLRYSRATKNIPGNPLNYGTAKGMTFERTLIYPHGPLKKYLLTGDLKDAGKEIDKIYVAITRARQSVAFVIDDNTIAKALTMYEP
jgi:DNA helicase-2/ATP-dependent DNA helicase PcrA